MLVAVLERRGRFLTAEPLFPPRAPSAAERPRTRGPHRIVVRPGPRGPGRDAAAGDLVLLSLGRGGAASVQRILGRPDVAADVIEGLMLDRGLRRGFDEEVERQAREAAGGVELQTPARRDLRALATFTIDPATARDFDDAISAEDLGGGRARVWVHIADVSAHVPEGTPLDGEARRRATSVYLPGTVEPMLPHSLSSGACSLMEGRERAAVTVEMEFDGDRVARTAFYRSLIRSDRRLDYEQVDRIFAGAERAQEPWAGPLAAARAVSARLAQRRERAGALVIDSEEPEFAFDGYGNVTGVSGRAQTESHRLIEHLMIAANEAVARLLSERRVPCLYRVHERPEPTRIERLVDQLASLEVPTPPVPAHLSSTQAADLLGEISRRVDEHVRRLGRGRIALSALVLRSLQQAYYSPRNLGHAGLHSTAYCHFTSPIRRYPDLVCHRALLSAVEGSEPAPRTGELQELGVWTSEREREAMTIERDGDDIARCFALARLLAREGPEREFPGEIAGLIGAGAFVAFPLADGEQTGAPVFEGMVAVRHLHAPAPGRASRSRERGAPSRPAAQRGRRGGPARGGGPRRGGPGGAPAREWWELNEEGTILHGEHSGAALRLGDAISVRVERIDAVRGRVDLRVGG